MARECDDVATGVGLISEVSLTEQVHGGDIRTTDRRAGPHRPVDRPAAGKDVPASVVSQRAGSPSAGPFLAGTAAGVGPVSGCGGQLAVARAGRPLTDGVHLLCRCVPGTVRAARLDR